MTRSSLSQLAPAESAAPDAVSVRDRILEVSTRMFSERGFAQVTIREIAAAAGAEAPTIYHYFGDKRSLYRTACVTCFVQRASRYYQAWRSPAPPAERIRMFVILLCESLSDDEIFRRLLQRELIDHDPDTMAELARTSFQEHFDELLALVKSLRASGDPVRLTFSIFALAFGFTQLKPVELAAKPPLEIANDAHALADLILATLLPGVLDAPLATSA